ncbi:hypothetical protein ABPG77_008565 [Micractinium sp. CCAP 211/92]
MSRSTTLLAAAMLVLAALPTAWSLAKSWERLGGPLATLTARSVGVGVDSQGVIYSGIATPSSGSYDDILVRRYDAAAKKWVLVGSILATTDSRLVGFATDPTVPASPWVAFADPSHSGRLSVKRWVQATSKWEYVGPPAISPSPVQRAPCLTFSPKGEPWIAFQGAALKPTAARYNKLDKQWYSASVPSSPDGKTSFTADWVTLAAGANGMVYMAYVDTSVPAENGRKGVVAAQNVTGTKFISDSKWSYAAFDQTTSKPYFSASSPEGLSLAIHPTTGVPHLSFTDAANSYRVSVMRPSAPAGKWQLVGTAGFGGSNPDLSALFVLDAYTSLAFTSGPTPIPLVAYLCSVDDPASRTNSVCVRQFVGGTWRPLGYLGVNFGQDTTFTMDLTVGAGKPLLAWSDIAKGGMDRTWVAAFQ